MFQLASMEKHSLTIASPYHSPTIHVQIIYALTMMAMEEVIISRTATATIECYIHIILTHVETDDLKIVNAVLDGLLTMTALSRGHRYTTGTDSEADEMTSYDTDWRCDKVKILS